MNMSTSATTASSASRSAGSRRRLRISLEFASPWLLDAHRGLPELLDPCLVVGRPLAVVVDQGDLIESRRGPSRGNGLANGSAGAELHVGIAGFLGQDPGDKRPRAGQGFFALHHT